MLDVNNKKDTKIKEMMKQVEVESKKRTRTAAIGHIVNDDKLFRQLQAEMRQRKLFTNDAVIATLHRGMLKEEQAHELEEKEQNELIQSDNETSTSTTTSSEEMFENVSYVKITKTDKPGTNCRKQRTCRSSLRCLEGDVMSYEDQIVPPPPTLTYNISDQYKKLTRAIMLQGAGKMNSVRTLMSRGSTHDSNSFDGSSNSSSSGVKKFEKKENIRAMYRRSLVAADVDYQPNCSSLSTKKVWNCVGLVEKRGQASKKSKGGGGGLTSFFARRKISIQN